MQWKVYKPKELTITDTWFAWYPVKMYNQYWIWLERVLRYRKYSTSRELFPWWTKYHYIGEFPKNFKQVEERTL